MNRINALIIILSLTCTKFYSQDLTSKKGEPILPEAKDWSIGIDANPFLNYIGNFFGKTSSNTAPSWKFLSTNQTIIGKYFLDPKTAVRGTFRIGFNGNTSRKIVTDWVAAAAAGGTAAAYPNPIPTTENSWKATSTAIGLAMGIEKRKGKTRLQGFYGAEAGIFIVSSKDRFTYGNALNAGGQGVTQVSVTAQDAFSGASNVAPLDSLVQHNSNVSINLGRVLERKNGTSFSFGVRAFVGAEYFIFPKISIGGEFGWGIGFTATGASTTDWESVGASGTSSSTSFVGTSTIIGSKQGNYSIDTDGKNSIWGPTASLRLALYF